MTISAPTSLGTNSSTTASITSLALTTTADINAGDLVVVAVTLQAASGVNMVTSVTDGTNTYVRRNFANDGPATYDVELWDAKNAQHVAAGATLTANFGAIGGVLPAINLHAAAISGLSTTNPADRIGSGQSAATTSITTTTAALSQGSEIVIGLSLSNTVGTETQSSGFANVSTSAAGALDRLAMDYQIVSSPAAPSYAPIWSISGQIVQLLTTYRGLTFDMASQSMMWSP